MITMARNTIDFPALKRELDTMSLAQLRAAVKRASKLADERRTPAALDYFRAAQTRLGEHETNVTSEGAPGSMHAALQSVGARLATPYAWFTQSSDGHVIVFTWRNREREHSWQLIDGVPTMDPQRHGASLEWRNKPAYSALLNAFDRMAPLHGDVVYTALSDDANVGKVGVTTKQTPGKNVLVINSDGTPTRFHVEFDMQRRWHRMTRVAGEDGNPLEQ